MPTLNSGGELLKKITSVWCFKLCAQPRQRGRKANVQERPRGVPRGPATMLVQKWSAVRCTGLQQNGFFWQEIENGEQWVRLYSLEGTLLPLPIRYLESSPLLWQCPPR